MRNLLLILAVGGALTGLALVPTLMSTRDRANAPVDPEDGESPPAAPPALARVAALAEPAVAPTARSPYVRVARTLEVFESAAEIGADGSHVENPCLRWAGTDCVRTALHPFFRALDGLARVPGAPPPETVRVVTFGNSMIASDHVTDIVRGRLQERFGDGGQGIVYVDELLYFGRRKWTGETDGGWYREYLTQHFTGDRPPAHYPLGVMGGHHISHRSGARTRWQLDGATRVKIHWLDHPSGSGFEVRVDGRTAAHVRPTLGEPRAQILRLEVPSDARELELIADGPRAVIYGATLEHPIPGVVFDTIGIVAASANSYLLTDEAVFEKQLRDRDPKLLLFMLGGNETRRIDRGVFNEAQVRQDFAAFVDRARAAAPDAACMTIGPLEAVWPAGKQKYEKRPYLDFVNKVEREISLEKGCAWFDFFAAMGGEGAVERFHKRGWMNDDLIHASGLGFDILGELVADAILSAYANERSAFGRADTLQERHEAIIARQLPPGAGLRVGRGERFGLALLGDGPTELFEQVSTRITDRLGAPRARLIDAKPCVEVETRGRYRGRRFELSRGGCRAERSSGNPDRAARVLIDPGGADALSARSELGGWRNVLRRGEARGALRAIDVPGGLRPRSVELFWRGDAPEPRVVALLAPDAGYTLDRRAAPPPAPLVAAAGWELALIFERDEARRAELISLVHPQADCVVVREPADPPPPEGCAVLDVAAALDEEGLAAARDRGWLEAGRLTPDGARAVGELLVHELVARPAPPVASAPGDHSPPG